MPTPTEPVITGYSTDTGTIGDNITADRSITFTGTGTPGASLEIIAFGAYSGTVAFLSAIPASGNWTVTVGDGGSYPVGSDGELQNGSYSFRAGSRIGADASSLSPALDITVDGPELSGIDLTSASDTGPSNTDNYTADSTPEIEFTAGNGDALEIDWGDGLGYQSVGTGTGGSQTFTNPNAYPNGITEEKTILVRSTKDGTSTVESLTFTYDRETTSPNGNIDASSDTGSSQTDHITSDTTPTLSGTGEVGATIEIKLGDGLSPTVATAIVGSGGTWSTTLSALSEGSYPLTLRSVDKAGNVNQLSGGGFTIDTTDPAAPAISATISQDTGISSTDRVTQDDTVRVSGTTEANTVVRIYDGAVLVGIDQTTSTGNWAITTSSLSDGVHTLRAEAEDLAGNKSILSSGLEVTVDTTAPAAPTLDLAAASDTGASSSDDVTSDTTPTLNGTAEAGTTVEVFDGSTSLGTTTANGSGAWSFTAAALSEGSHNLTAVATDLAGNTSPAATALAITIDTTAPAAPTLDLAAASDTGASSSDDVTSDTTPTLNGTAEAGTTVEVFDGSTSLGTTTANGSGAWSFTAAALSEGSHSLTAVATDLAGNTSPAATALSITIDTTAPTAPTLDLAAASDTGASSSDDVTSDTTPTLNGTAEAGTTVEVFDGSTSLGTTTANGSGAWSFTTAALGEGSHSLTAVATDLAGNTSPAATALDVTIDTTAPGVPVISGFSDDTGVAGDGVTSDTTPTLSGTAEANITVQILRDGVLVGSVTADGSGDWSFTNPALTEDTYSFVARAVDTAGNTSSSDALSIRISSAVVATPVITAITDDTGATDGVTSDSSLAISGTSVAGATIELFLGAVSLGTTTANGTGSWSFDYSGTDLADGDYTFTARASLSGADPSGLSTGFDVTIDTTAPAAPTLDLAAASDTGASSSDNVTSDRMLELVGTAETGSLVEVFDGSISLGSVAAVDGSWAFTTPNLSDGVHSLTVVATDTAGNVSPTATPVEVTVDRIAPTVPTLSLAAMSDSGVAGDGKTTIAAPTLVGTAEAGALVEILRDGVVVGSATADAAGDWSYTSPELDVDTYAFKARSTDAAGNTSEQSTATPVEILPLEGAVPVITRVGKDSGISNSDGITADTTPAIRGTGVAGENVTVFVNGDEIGTVVVKGSGKWVLPFAGEPLEDGAYSITATAKADDGIVSDPSAVFALIIDTEAPEISAPNLIRASDSGNLRNDDLTNDTSPTVKFTAEDGASIEVDWGDGSGFIAAGTGNGSAQKVTLATPYGSDGVKTVQLRATDAAGNSTVTTLDLTVDTEAPSTGAVTGFEGDTGIVGDHVTTDRRLVFNGTADPASTVSVLLNGVAVGVALSDATGAWTFDYTDVRLKAGEYVLTLSTSDGAGNLAPLSGGFDFTVLNQGKYEITTDAIDTAVSYEVGTVIARLEVLNFAGDVDYSLAKTFRGTVGLDGDEIVITGDFDPTKIRSLDIGVTATIAGGEQVTGTIDLSDFIAVGLVGPDGIMRGGPGDDTMTGTGGDDIVFAGFGDDRIEGGNGNDAINGGAGNDTITDKDGDDILVGAKGDDVLLAMNGRNVLSGGKGNDVLLGGLGKDRLKGGAGNDILKSDSSAQIGGRDHLNGGRGDDLLEGGIGSDTFVFRTDQGNDTIGHINIDFTDTQASTVDNADFQSGLDKVALIGFGYTDSGEAFAHLSDVNGEATFADQGLTIRFAGLTVADLAETDFFIY